jgi:putative PEP-CTERM system histidine kinase
MQCPQEVIDESHSIVCFLKKTGWVIDFREYSGDRDRYELLRVDDELPGRAETAFVVPLLNEGDLLGFVFLSQPRTQQILNYEDHDLLKTAGKQIASYLAQELSTEHLAESRQFEAFNRLTAYLMHDLKNLIAQQSLVVENAEKHKDNPEFIDDAMATIKGGVDRLRRVIENIQQNSIGQPVQRVELGKLILQVVSQCSDRQPVPKALIDDNQLWVRADKERLSMAVYHVLRNAQDATPPDGEVSIELVGNDTNCVIVVSDTGDGMDEAYIRDHLFRPFDSTKGTQGMGIGAYQMRETIWSMGGHVAVSSEPKSGTKVTMTLQVADR